MLAKILGLTITNFNDLKPQTPVVYHGLVGTIYEEPSKRLQSGPYRVPIHFGSDSPNAYAQFILIGNQINWLGPRPRHLNPIERLLRLLTD